MRRYGIPCFLALSLIVFGIPSSNAAVIPGSKCSKVGTKQTYKGKIFTCIKLGSKLYWNNGVIAKKDEIKASGIPATCNITDEKTTFVVGGISNTGEQSGTILYSGKLQNVSPKSTATNINVYFDWFDSLGQFNREKITFPRLLPGQVLEFGTSSNWTYESSSKVTKQPDLITMRSTCRSEDFKLRTNLILGKSVVTPVSSVVDENNGVVTIMWEVAPQIVVDNIFDKSLSCKEQVDCNFSLYVIYKDNFGNVIGGSLGGVLDSEEIEPGDSGVMTTATTIYFDDLPVDTLLSRITRYEYTLVPNF